METAFDGKPAVDTGRHPLSDGIAPDWADGWGWDDAGVFVEVVMGEVIVCLRWCPPGRFRMGSPEGEPGRWKDEGPITKISFTDGFWMMATPVTQALWTEVMQDNPSRFKSPDRPVETVSWDESQAFIERLNGQRPDLGLRLPTEAEWEYACRAGTETATYAGSIEVLGKNNAPILDEIAWYGGNSGVAFDLEEGEDSSDWPEKQYPHERAGTRIVAWKAPNPWGLHDMLGNVWEWCADVWHASHEGADTSGGPRQASRQEDDPARVIRGGSWFDRARFVRTACRDRGGPDYRNGYLGFRLARGRQVVSSVRPERVGDRVVKAGEAEPPAYPHGDD